MATAEAIRILYGETDANAFEQTDVLRNAGYDVSEVVGRKRIEEALEGGRFDVVILGHTLNKDDRHHLPYHIKKSNPQIRILVLHASGHHPKVDLALDSRHGDVLRTVSELLLQPVGT